MTTAPVTSGSAFASCPLPQSQYNHILLGHGSGGRLTADLIQRVFLPAFDNSVLSALEDQATVSLNGRDGAGEPGCVSSRRRIALTTDSFVVRPLCFPGGDIGKLAVHGTVNDLAVGGALPQFLAAAFILEEGLALADLQRIVSSMREACDASGVALVTGDTKVVDRGKGDQVFITTTGVGLVPEGRCLSIRNARPGDRILVSGTIGEETAVFEAVHGSAPDIADKNLANPTALLLSGLMLLDHIGDLERATRIRAALDRVLAAGTVRTRDLGGTASTTEFTEAICREIEK